MDSTIEVRNGRRCRIDVMRRDAAGNVTTEFVTPLDDEPESLIHNGPQDSRFVRADNQNTADVSKLPVLVPPGGNIRNVAASWPNTNPIQNSGGEDVSKLPILKPPSYQNTKKKDNNRR